MPLGLRTASSNHDTSKHVFGNVDRGERDTAGTSMAEDDVALFYLAGDNQTSPGGRVVAQDVAGFSEVQVLGQLVEFVRSRGDDDLFGPTSSSS